MPENMSFVFNNRKKFGNVMKSHHCHDDKFEIYYMVTGKCRYFIDDKPYEVIKGDVVLIPEGTIHRTDYDQSESMRVLIECTRHFIPEEIRDKITDLPYIYRNPTAAREIHQALKRIEDEYKLNDDLTVEALVGHMRIFFYLLVRNTATMEKTTAKNAMIEETVAFIKENYQTEITLSAVAKSHFVSPEHLSRTFKRETGFGFNEYLTIVRLQHAELLLRRRCGLSISDIAYSCGFNDSNYFSDRFRKAYGLPPLRYSKTFEGE